jgi:non-lysosomal glucosylceramidase
MSERTTAVRIPDDAIRGSWPLIPQVAWNHAIGVPAPRVGRPRPGPSLIDDGAWAGVPIGGLGCGSIGRTYRGDFRRWHLTIGEHRAQTVAADAFSIFVGRPGSGSAHVLTALGPADDRGWGREMPIGGGTYHALFPRAWFAYDWPDLSVRVVEEQLSPVIAGDYDSSALPVGVFTWTVENPTTMPLTVGLMLSWLDTLAVERGISPPVRARPRDDGEIAGVEWTAAASPGGMPASLAIAVEGGSGIRVSLRIVPNASALATVWDDFAFDGALDESNGEAAGGPADAVRDGDVPGDGGSSAAALAATVELGAGERRRIRFALGWDLPEAIFASGRRLRRRHTLTVGSVGDSAFHLAAEAIARSDDWRAAIDDWQRPILDDAARPPWYRQALFNELYFLVDGGTIWTDEGDGGIGRFALLECFDYAFYNTLDVNFYASFALLRLFPALELSVIHDFAAVVDSDDADIVTIDDTGQPARRKTRGALPHDLGGPDEDPIDRPNRYRFQDPNIWKDLNPKFVLQLWRDHVATGDLSIVRNAWPAVVQALKYIGTFDRDGDGLPEHDDVPDQTYDQWPMLGPSAYGGSLWIAALAAGVEMARRIGDRSVERGFGETLGKARASFEAKLWTGSHYAYDLDGGAGPDTVMADQLVGQWYADATGLGDIVAPDRVERALRTIHRLNVEGFAGGSMGPVNGMTIDGRVVANRHAEEVWTGTAYALAAFMIGRGLVDEGWQIARGVVEVTYGRGLWFRTPEAYDAAGNFRATMYLRPLAIWAIEEAIERCRRVAAAGGARLAVGDGATVRPSADDGRAVN